jgi:hypothetical protein
MRKKRRKKTTINTDSSSTKGRKNKLATPKFTSTSDIRNFFSIRFTITFVHRADICYIAYHYPYTYTYLQVGCLFGIFCCRVLILDNIRSCYISMRIKWHLYTSWSSVSYNCRQRCNIVNDNWCRYRDRYCQSRHCCLHCTCTSRRIKCQLDDAWLVEHDA